MATTSGRLVRRAREEPLLLLAVVLLAGMGAVLLAVVLFLPKPLGYDEAVYASKTRSYVTDIPAT